MRLVVVALLMLLTSPVRALEITNVSHAPAAIDPGKGEITKVRFRLSDPARVTLRIFDGRDLSIRAISSAKQLGAGDHALDWNGRDELGRPVPPEAYVYTLTAASPKGESVEHDLTDLSDAATSSVAARWDPGRRRVLYELASPARVNVRVGLANGPLLRTVSDWVARAAGPHAEPWDGKDESGLIDAAKNPDLEVGAQAWPLPKNAIVVLPERSRVELVKLDWPETRGTKKRESPRRERALDQQPIERRGDVRIRLSLPADLARDADGTPIASGKVAIRLDVDPADRARLTDQRFEVGFFLDGKYVFENEVGFLPMTWVWDAGAVNAGVHYVTGNVWGYAGQFGTNTIAIRAAPAAATK